MQLNQLGPCKIVIPSHKRHDKVETLKLLPNAIICVEYKQLEAYKEYNPDNEIVTHPNTVIGLPAKRNWMVKHFGELFMIDDDIYGFRKLYVKPHEPNQIKEEEEIVNKIQALYHIAKMLGVSLFKFNRKPHPLHYDAFKPFTLSTSITGCAYGAINGPNMVWDETLKVKEDYYISSVIKYYERKVLVDNRYNFAQKDTFVNSGGLSGTRTQEAEEEAALKLRKLFGECITLKQNQKLSKTKHKFQTTTTYNF